MNGFNQIIKLWTIYGFNYDPGFIKEAFSDQSEMMIKHLELKFQEARNIAGTYGVFFYFWSMLDVNMQNQLETWVLDNFKG